MSLVGRYLEDQFFEGTGSRNVRCHCRGRELVKRGARHEAFQLYDLLAQGPAPGQSNGGPLAAETPDPVFLTSPNRGGATVVYFRTDKSTPVYQYGD